MEQDEIREARIAVLEARVAAFAQMVAALARGSTITPKRRKRELTPEERELGEGGAA